MKVQFRNFFLFLAMIFLGSDCLFGQENPASITVTIEKNTTYSLVVSSYGTPIFISYPESSSEGTTLDISSQNPDYLIEYFPATDFVGEDNFVLEYYTPGSFPGQAKPKVILFKVYVVETLITIGDDYLDVPDGTSNFYVDVLANDVSGLGELEISSIAQSMNCTVNITADSLLYVEVDPNFSGMAYAKYVASDDKGSADGLLCLKLNGGDVNTEDTLNYYITNDRDLDLVFAEDGFDLANNSSPILGSLSILGLDRLRYTPNQDAAGEETFEITNGSINKTVNIQLIPVATAPGKIVVDDYYATSVGHPITFDAIANDHRSYPIVDHSPELIKDADGKLVYTPQPSDFGELEFFYTVNVNNGNDYQTGKIFIRVDNFNLDSYDLSFATPQNVARVLSYNIPLTDHSFNVVSPPNFGDLDVYHGLDTISIDCNEVIGRELIVYSPDQDFVGTDYFEIEYCNPNQTCQIVKVDIEIFDNSVDTLCHCVKDCVWEGDTNNDGKVSIVDVLPIGLHLGEGGTDRIDIDYSQRHGQHAEHWNAPISSSFDLKHVDANGDGIISVDDTSAINTYYNEVHDIIPFQPLGVKQYFPQLIPNQESYEVGDLAVLSLSIGTDEYPIVDLHGLAMRLNINPSFIDSSTLDVNFYENDWFTYTSPSIELHKQLKDGQIDAAFSRTKGTSVSGVGVIADFSFIVEEEPDGFRLEDGQVLVPFVINVTDVYTIDGTGELFRIPDFSQTVYLNIEEKEEEILHEEQLILRPNPASENLMVHLNGGSLIESVQILDVLGKEYFFQNMINQNQIDIPVSSYINGQYFVRIKTTNGMITKAFQVFK